MKASASRDASRCTTFVVRYDYPPEGVDADVTAHIKQTANLRATIAEHGATLSDSVLDIVADLLFEIACEDGDRREQPA